MGKEHKKGNHQIENKNKGGLSPSDGLVWVAGLGLVAGWETLKLGYKTTRFTLKNSWKYGVRPLSEKVVWPLTKFTAKSLAKGSQRFACLTNEHIIQPAWKKMNEELDKPADINRRKLLYLMGTSLVVGVAGTTFAFVKSGNNVVETTQAEGLKSEPTQAAVPSSTAVKTENTPTPPKVEPTKTPEFTKESTYENPFAGVRANEIAKELGMNAGSFYKVSPFTMENLKKFNNGKLLKIFPPSVMQYKNEIEKLAKQYAISPNIVALIMTIESQGDKNAGSEAGAKGLMQVMPGHFPANMTDAQMKEVMTNIEKGINVFITFFNYSKNNNTGYASIMEKALMGYNGGGRGVTNNYEELIANDMGETCFYGEHVIRFILTLEIAVRLREEGYSDTDIVKMLRSDEIEARAYALKNSGFDGIREYLGVTDSLSDKELKGNSALKNNYNKYKNTPSLKINFPGTPGLVIFWGSGGRNFTLMDINKNEANWY